MMEDGVSWSVGEPATLRQQTVATLREALLNDVFKPGEQLVERKLADLTGVSRTSIREALSQLEAEGLLTRVPGKGMVVTQLTEDEALRIYEARAILESAIARLFVQRATDDEIKELAERIAESEATNVPERARLHAEKLDAVSDLIMDGARNEIMRQMASILRARVTYLRTVTSRVASVERRSKTMVLLRGILEAFQARDADLAERLTRDYVERSAAFATMMLRDAGMNEGRLSDKEEMESQK